MSPRRLAAGLVLAALVALAPAGTASAQDSPAGEQSEPAGDALTLGGRDWTAEDLGAEIERITEQLAADDTGDDQRDRLNRRLEILIAARDLLARRRSLGQSRDTDLRNHLAELVLQAFARAGAAAPDVQPLADPMRPDRAAAAAPGPEDAEADPDDAADTARRLEDRADDLEAWADHMEAAAARLRDWLDDQVTRRERLGDERRNLEAELARTEDPTAAAGVRYRLDTRILALDLYEPRADHYNGVLEQLTSSAAEQVVAAGLLRDARQEWLDLRERRADLRLQAARADLERLEEEAEQARAAVADATGDDRTAAALLATAAELRVEAARMDVERLGLPPPATDAPRVPDPAVLAERIRRLRADDAAAWTDVERRRLSRDLLDARAAARQGHAALQADLRALDDRLDELRERRTAFDRSARDRDRRLQGLPDDLRTATARELKDAEQDLNESLQRLVTSVGEHAVRVRAGLERRTAVLDLVADNHRLLRREILVDPDALSRLPSDAWAALRAAPAAAAAVPGRVADAARERPSAAVFAGLLLLVFLAVPPVRRLLRGQVHQVHGERAQAASGRGGVAQVLTDAVSEAAADALPWLVLGGWLWAVSHLLPWTDDGALLRALALLPLVLPLGLRLVHRLLCPDCAVTDIVQRRPGASRVLRRAVVVSLVAWAALGWPREVFTALGWANPAGLVLLSLAFKTVLVVAMISALIRRRVFRALVPPGEGAVRRVLEVVIGLVQPLALLFVAGVWLVEILGWTDWAADLWRGGLGTLALVLVGPAAVTLVARLVAGRVRAMLTPDADEEDAEPPEETLRDARRRRALVRAASWAVAAGGAVAVILSVLTLWGLPPDRLQAALARPLPGQGAETADPLTWGNVIRFVIIVWLVFVVPKAVRRTLDLFVLPAEGMDRGLRYTIITLTGYVVVALGVLVALGAVQVGMDELQWILAAAGLGIGFGLQEIVSNFVCGLILLFERPLQVGDVVTVDDKFGTVTRINIRSTTITTLDNVHLLIPNKEFIVGTVINWSYGDLKIRLRVPFGVAYGSDIDTVRRSVMEAAERHGKILTNPKPEPRFVGFGNSSLDFELHCWIADPVDRMPTTSDMLYAIEAAFRRNGVEIPFPQRDLHVRSGQALKVRLEEGPPAAGAEAPETAGDDEGEAARPSPPRIPGADAGRPVQTDKGGAGGTGGASGSGGGSGAGDGESGRAGGGRND